MMTHNCCERASKFMIAIGFKVALSVLLLLIACHSVGVIVVLMVKPRQIVTTNDATENAFESENSKNTRQVSSPPLDQSGQGVH